jgi:hypothetical protein
VPDPIEFYHGSPSELVVIGVTVDGVAVSSGYVVCLYPLGGVEPLEGDIAWQTPDTAGSDSGVLVGSQHAGKVYTAGQTVQPWYMVTSSPEKVIGRSSPLVRFT